MLKKVSVRLMGEIPDDFEINIPTNEELLGPLLNRLQVLLPKHIEVASI
jgi:hypothetical protein